MPQIFQPFLAKKAIIINTAQSIKAENVAVMIRVTWFIQKDIAR